VLPFDDGRFGCGRVMTVPTPGARVGFLPASRNGSALLAGEYVGLPPRKAAEDAGLFEHAG
jgi:hypothetical protein